MKIRTRISSVNAFAFAWAGLVSTNGFSQDLRTDRDFPRFFYYEYLQPIITQYFIDNKSEIWLLFLIAHSKR